MKNYRCARYSAEKYIIEDTHSDDYYFNDNYTDWEHLCKLLDNQKKEIQSLEKEVEYLKILHMQTMFNIPAKDIELFNDRYHYDKEQDLIFNITNRYGSYNQIVDKKYATFLLNESMNAVDLLKIENAELKSILQDTLFDNEATIPDGPFIISLAINKELYLKIQRILKENTEEAK